MRLRAVLLGGVLVAGLGLFSGCATGPKAPFEPSYAGVYTGVTAPLSMEFDATAVQGLRSGSSSAINVMGIVAAGDCGLAAAIRDGNLKTVEYVDYTNFNVLGVFQKTTVTAYGK